MSLQHALVYVVLVGALVSSAGVEAQKLRGQTTQVAQNDAGSFHAAMLQRVNEERAKNGLGKLCYNSKLQKAAQDHSNDQAAQRQMSHTGSDGSSMSQRVTQVGYKWNGVAENIAAGQKDVESVMDSWMKSAGHKANILGAYTHFGMGYTYNADDTFKSYWTQVFASGSSEGCDSSGSTQNAAPPPGKSQQMQNDGARRQTLRQQGASQSGFGFSPGLVHPSDDW